MFHEQALLLVVEPKDFAEANNDDDWIKACMNEYWIKLRRTKIGNLSQDLKTSIL